MSAALMAQIVRDCQWAATATARGDRDLAANCIISAGEPARDAATRVQLGLIRAARSLAVASLLASPEFQIEICQAIAAIGELLKCAPSSDGPPTLPRYNPGVD